MSLTGQESIQESYLIPSMKPEANRQIYRILITAYNQCFLGLCMLIYSFKVIITKGYNVSRISVSLTQKQ